MLAILYYCLKVIICSGFLFGYYLLALRNNRFHQWNRFYLLAAVIISFTLPFLKIPLPFFSDNDERVIQSLTILSAPDIYFSKLHQQSFDFTWPMMLGILYACVAVFLITMFIRNLLRVQRLKSLYPCENLNGIHFYNTSEAGTPFSFFKNIFWNSSISLNNEKGQQMLRHEITHIQEKHSVDKVALEILIAFAWWNPFLYYIRKELSVIHEFIADKKAFAGDDNLQYASLLLMKAMGIEQYTLGNPFFHTQLKRRLLMLTTNKNPKLSYLRRLMVLPLAIITVGLFSFKYKQENKVTEDVRKKQLSNQTVLEPAIETPIAVHGFYEDSTRKKQAVVKLKKEYKGSPVVNITPTDDLKGVVVKTRDGKTYFLDRGQANNEFGIKLIESTWTIQGKSSNVDLTDTQLLNDSTNKPLYIIDGKTATDAEVSKLDPNKIKSMDIWKGKKATDLYGDKGNNGVITITTKEPALPDDALYIIDGVESTKTKADHLNPDAISTINVSKGETAIKAYGDKGKNGVIVITTKLAKNEVTFSQAEQAGKLSQPSEIMVKGHRIQKTDTTVVGYQTNNNAVFTKVEEPAMFPGGVDGWRRYLSSSLKYPEAAQEKGTQGVV